MPAVAKHQKALSAKQIRSIRERAGLTQSEAAAKVGVSRRSWAAWEGGETRPTPPLVLLIQLLDQGKL